MKTTFAAAAALAVFAFASPASAQTSCKLHVQEVGAVGSVGGALRGGSLKQIWVIQQCVDKDGQVRTSVAACEIPKEVDPRIPVRCTAPEKIGESVSKQ